MNFDHLKAKIARVRVQIKRQQRDILDLQRAGISTVSDVACWSGCRSRWMS